ncbi:Ig-like domain-containing protein [Bacillus mycoides]
MKKVAKVLTLVLLSIVFSNVGNMNVYAAESEYPDNPDTLPIVHYVKNEASGLRYGAQVDPDYGPVRGQNPPTISAIEDKAAPSGYVMRLYATQGNFSESDLQWYQPKLYENTNYTAEYVVKNVGGNRQVRRYWHGDNVNKEVDIGSAYVTISDTFKTSKTDKPSSIGRSQVFAIVTIGEDWRLPLKPQTDLRFMSIKYIPNTPVIAVTNQTLTVNLSDVKGKNRADIVKIYEKQINTLLNQSSIDTNNNNNPVLTTVNNIPNSQTVINSSSDGFDVDILAKKWGEKQGGKLQIKIVNDLADKPEMNPIKEIDKEITGTGTPGDEIIVRNPVGKEIGKTTVDKNGKWKVTVPTGTKLIPGEEITAKAKKPGKEKESDPAKQVVTEEVAKKPEMNPIKETDKEITGTGTPGDEIIVRDPSRKEIGKTTVDKDGKWKVTVPTGTKLTPGEEITAKAKKPGRNKESDPAKQVVTEEVAKKPEMNPIKETDKEITGTGTPGDEIIVRDPSRKEIGKTTVDKDGKWKVTVPTGTKLTPGEEITAKAKKPGRNKESDPAKQVVTEEVAKKPEMNPIKETDKEITGTGTPGDEIIVRDPSRKEIGKTTVDKDGKWKVTVPTGTKLIPGEKITAKAKKPGREKESDPTEQIVKEKSTVRIDNASSLDFGKQKITTKDEQYKAKNDKNHVLIKSNSDEGWSLQVKQNGQFKSESGKELKGAEIKFNTVTVDPLGDHIKTPSYVKTAFSLTPDGTGITEKIVVANQGEGNGDLRLIFDSSSSQGRGIELYVPGNTTKYAEKYSTSLTWTLADVPAQE